MKTFDWEELLRNHSVFELLGDADRTEFLAEDISVERQFRNGEVILRQGAIGTSIFVVGKGRARVMLERANEEPVTLYTVTRGELIGEMALFEDRPRAATVEATEDTLLLEIKGEPFLQMLKDRSEIALILLAKMSRRLRYTDQKVLERRFKGLDETVTVINARIDAALDSGDAKLAAAKTMFEQTNIRTNEVIAGGQRANMALKLFVGLFAAVGGLGLWNLYDQREAITNIRAESASDAREIEIKLTELTEKLRAADQQLRDVQRASNRVHGLLDRSEVAGLVDKIKLLDFDNTTMSQMASALQNFDREVVAQLSQALLSVVIEQGTFHNELEPVVGEDGVSNPNAIVFVNYFRAVSAIYGPDNAFADVKTKLRREIESKIGTIKRPRYLDNNTRDMLKMIATRPARNAREPSPEVVDRRWRHIDDLMDLMETL